VLKNFRFVMLGSVIALPACGHQIQSVPLGGASYAVRSSDGVERLIYDFPTIKSGVEPTTGVIAGDNGEMFGTTYLGGTGVCGYNSIGCGLVYELTLAGNGFKERTIYNFKGAPDSAAPTGLVRYKKNLYGVTMLEAGFGTQPVLFELTPSGNGFVEKTLYDFPSPQQPTGISVATSGALFVTNGASARTNGSIDRFDMPLKRPLNPIVYTFSEQSNGEDPRSPLVIESSGTVFGTSAEGGTGSAPECLGVGCGTIFKLVPSGKGYKETVVYNFAGGTDGAIPNAPIIDAKGTLYASAGLSAGSDCVDGGCGTVFSFKPASRTFTLLYSFSRQDLWWPNSQLVSDASGALYGTTGYDGYQITNDGGLFKLTPKKGGFSETTVYTFAGPPADGQSPRGDLLLAPTGNALFGTTFWGGPDDGTVYEIKI
jgi:uncharacterized repeat protein (TIGR03803 family)